MVCLCPLWARPHALGGACQAAAGASLPSLSFSPGSVSREREPVWSTECLLVRGRATEPSVRVDEAPVIGGLDYLRTIPPIAPLF